MRYISTKGWEWEGDVPPPVWSTKLKVIYELKMNKTPDLHSFLYGRTFYNYVHTCI